MEWNNGMENGMEQRIYTVAANSCNWHCSIYVELPSGFYLTIQALSKLGIANCHASISRHGTVASRSSSGALLL